MKDIVLNQILPKIEKLISPYLLDARGNAADKKYYVIAENKQSYIDKNEKEQNVIKKLVEQANDIRHAATIPSANDDFFSGIYGSLETALAYLITINCKGWFSDSKLQEDLAYETKQIFGAVKQYQTDRQRKHAEALERAAQVQKQLDEERAKYAAESMKTRWYEAELAIAAHDPTHLIGKTPAYFAQAASTPAHPHQKLLTGNNTPGQKTVNPGTARGTMASSVPQSDFERDKNYLNEYFGPLPTKILELLSCLSNIAEVKDFAISAIEERILNYENPAPVDLVTRIKNLLPAQRDNRNDLEFVDKVLDDLSILISRDNTGESHKDYVSKLESNESGRLAEAAIGKTSNVNGVTVKYQILLRIDQYLLPRPNKAFLWKKALLPDFSEAFLNKLHTKMADAMNFPSDATGEKKAKLIMALNNQYKQKPTATNVLTMTK